MTPENRLRCPQKGKLIGLLNLKWYCFLPLWLLVGWQLAIGQAPNFTYFSTEEGLSATVCFSRNGLLRDSQGFLWICTGAGLNRFDGKEIVKYEGYKGHSKGLESNSFWAICEAADGQLWVGTRGEGIYLFDPLVEQFSRFDTAEVPKAITESLISFIEKDANNDLWIGTVRYGVYRYDWITKTFQYIPQILSDSLPFSGYHSDKLTELDEDGTAYYKNAETIFFARDGAIWLGSSAGLHRYDSVKDVFGATFQSYPGSKDYFKTPIQDIAADKNGLLWTVSGFRGRQLFNPKTEQFSDFPVSIKLASEQLTPAVVVDPNGVVWLGAEGGITKYHPSSGLTTRLPFIANNKQSAPLRTYSYYFDETGGAWIMTGGQGLAHLPAPFVEMELIKKEVKAFSKADQGEFFLLTNQGLTLYNESKNTWSNAAFPKEVRQQIGTSVHRFQNGVLAIIANEHHQVLLYDPATQTIDRNKLGLGMVLDTENNYWVLGSIYEKEQPTEWKRLSKRLDRHFGKSESTRIPFNLDVDQLGRIWGATDTEGLFVYFPKEDRFHLFADDPNYPKRITNKIPITTLYPSRDGGMYVGTTAGLVLINPDLEVSRFYTKEDGLPTSQVDGIGEDAQGNLWLGTFSGISYLDRATETFWNIYPQDGLPGEVMHASVLSHDIAVGDDGLVYLIADENFYRFDPKQLVQNEIVAPISLTTLSVHNNTVEPLDSTGILQQTIGTTDLLTLDYQQNDFSIGFISPTLAQAEKLTYFYQLENHDSGWRNVGNNTVANYSNVPAGYYFFKVKAETSNGTKTPNEVRLPIIITPPWWQTWWAYTLLAALISALAYSFYRFQLNQQLAQAEAKRLAELNQTKSRFYTNITHEFRTPLTVILGMAEQIEGQAGKTNLIKRNGKKLLQLIQQVLDLSKLDNQQLQPNYQAKEIVSLVQYIGESFDSLAVTKGVRLMIYSEIRQLVAEVDELKLQQIISNLLSNAIKFTPKTGKVILHLTQEAQHLCLKVKDTGIGIAEEALPHIFDRFYQVENAASKRGEGTGIGLALVKELVELMEGTITVKSEWGAGTEFLVRLPIRTVNEVMSPFEPVKKSDFADSYVEQKTIAFSKLSDQTTSELPHLLMVEDNPDVVLYMQSILANHYQIRIATDGQEGIDLAMEYIPDLIISDVMMPGKDGFALVETLKEAEQTSHIPIVLLTAKATQQAKLKGLQYGADAYLLKPFDQMELLIRLEKLLATRQLLQQKYAKWTPYEVVPKTVEELFLEKLHQVHDKNYQDSTLKVEKIAQLMDLNYYHYRRKLAALTNQTPAVYLRSFRLQKAKNLLTAKKEINISEVAYAVGFDRPDYFSRAFAEEFGQSPSAFR